MNPTLTDAALDVPQIEKGLTYLEQLLHEVLDESEQRELLTAFQDEATDINQGHLAKVYSIYFQLFNIVEEYTVISYRRTLEDKFGLDRVSGLFGQAFVKLKESGSDPRQLADRLGSLRIEPVFTAHPTESKRTTILEQLHVLFEHYARINNLGGATKADENEAKRMIKLALHRLWRTGEVYIIKPSVHDELGNIIHYLNRSLPPAIESLDQRMVAAWTASGLEGDISGQWRKWPRISFGDWVGGDRDGHPFVTADVTSDTLQLLRSNALEMIRERLLLLGKRLSFSEEWMHTPEALTVRIKDLAETLGKKGEKAIERNKLEPWRQYINMLRVRMPLNDRNEAVAPEDNQYKDAKTLVEDLAFLYEQMSEAGAKPIADSEIIPVIRLVQTFGFHLAKLDIRQNSRFHDLALSQLMTAAGIPDAETFPEWPEERRMGFLSEELRSPRPFVADIDQVGNEAQQAVRTLKVVRKYCASYGDEGVGSLIVSMTRQTSDLLVVYLLAREAGLVQSSEGVWYCPVQVVPLFETIDDLLRSEDILNSYLSVEATKATLRSRRDNTTGVPVQQVMIGYSDSNKDGGIFSSLWSLQRAQRKLSAIGAKHGVDILFFHGRGGSVSRGAGPTHRFVASCPPEALKAGFRITEQGEVIAQKYARLPSAVYNLEVQLAGLLMNQKTTRDTEAATWLESIGEELSRQSFKAYETLVRQPGFITFFAEATPIDVIEMSGIGSRPARRTGQRTLADLRAIPWAFSWSQCRIYFPAWYGVGSALDALRRSDAKSYARLRQEWSKHPGLHYIITNVTSALILANRDIMMRYAGLVNDIEIRERILGMILTELQLTTEVIHELIGGPISNRRPGMSKIMELRNRKLSVLHETQVNQLREWRAIKASGDEKAAAAMLPSLLQVVNAIAGGLRATG